MFRVPGSTCFEDEFLAPTGQWLSIYRAITYDGWMLWKDALPEEVSLRQRLDLDTYENICQLAKRIHVIHQGVENCRRLVDTPFQISRWWDPVSANDEPDENWDLGCHVLFRVKEMTAKQFMAVPQRRNQVYLRAVSTNWMEATLPSDVSKGLPLPLAFALHPT